VKKPEHLLAPALLGTGVLAFLAAWAHRLAIGGALSAALALLLALSGFALALYAAPRAGLWGTLALLAAGAGLAGVWNANLALFTVLAGLLVDALAIGGIGVLVAGTIAELAASSTG